MWAAGNNGYGQLGDGTTNVPGAPIQVMTHVVAVSAGGYYASGVHSLFLKEDGTAWAAGNNASGQLGDGTTTDRPTPVMVMTDVAAISVGGGHSLFLKNNGTVWAVGRNGDGQLGDGTTTDRVAPVEIMGGVKEVSAGANHSLFLKEDGFVWAAGSAYGIGVGGPTSRRTTPVQGLSGVASISAGGEHSLFLRTDGTVWAAGGNDWGELGDGTQSFLNIPVMVTSDAVAVAAGSGFSLVLKADGTVWAAGRNTSGQRGDYSGAVWYTFAQVATDVVSISAGGGHSLFLKSDGRLWASGYNAYGALALQEGTHYDRNSIAITSFPLTGIRHEPRLSLIRGNRLSAQNLEIGTRYLVETSRDSVRWDSSSYQFVAIGPEFVSDRYWPRDGDAPEHLRLVTLNPHPVHESPLATSAGGTASFSLFLYSDGSLWGAGGNLDGALGVEGRLSESFYSATTVPIPLMSDVRAVAVGDQFSLRLKNDGTVWGAGYNSYGQLGTGNRDYAPTPVAGMTGVKAISAGSGHSLFLKTDGTVWGAGYNTSGQLGNGKSGKLEWQVTPVQVMSDVKAISAGPEHTLFLKSDGTAWGAGNNGAGQLGDGTTVSRSSPVEILSGVRSVFAIGNKSFFIMSDLTVRAVGDNYLGTLGNRSVGSSSKRPVVVVNEVEPLSEVVAIAGSILHTLFLKTDGTVWAVGSNTYGVMGTGDLRYSETFVLVAEDVVAMAASRYHSLFLKRDGSIWGTGHNGLGALGDGTTERRNQPVVTLGMPFAPSSLITPVASQSFPAVQLGGSGSLAGSIFRLETSLDMRTWSDEGLVYPGPAGSLWTAAYWSVGDLDAVFFRLALVE